MSEREISFEGYGESADNGVTTNDADSRYIEKDDVNRTGTARIYDYCYYFFFSIVLYLRCRVDEPPG